MPPRGPGAPADQGPVAGRGYTPGQKLSVEELSRELEVSKQPIMEALRLLSADGLVTIIRRSAVECRL